MSVVVRQTTVFRGLTHGAFLGPAAGLSHTGKCHRQKFCQIRLQGQKKDNCVELNIAESGGM